MRVAAWIVGVLFLIGSVAAAVSGVGAGTNVVNFGVSFLVLGYANWASLRTRKSPAPERAGRQGRGG